MADQHHVAVTSEEHYNDRVRVQFDERQELIVQFDERQELIVQFDESKEQQFNIPIVSEEPSSDCRASTTEVLTTEDTPSSSDIVHEKQVTETTTEGDSATGSSDATQLPVEGINNPDLSKEVSVDRTDNPEQNKLQETTSIVNESPDTGFRENDETLTEQSDFLQETNKLLDTIIKEHSTAALAEQVATDQEEEFETVPTSVDEGGRIISETQKENTDKQSEEPVSQTESLPENTADIVSTKEAHTVPVAYVDSPVTKLLIGSSLLPIGIANQTHETPLSRDEQNQPHHVIATEVISTKPETSEISEDSHKLAYIPETDKPHELMNDTNDTLKTPNQTDVELEDSHSDISNIETDKTAEDVMNQPFHKETHRPSKESIMEIFAEQEKSFRDEFLSPSTVPMMATADKVVSEKESPVTPSKLGVGIEHLENLVRLMEQLTQLRGENLSLLKTVAYLEDTKSLLLMQNEILTSKGGEDVSGIAEQKKVKHYFTDLSYHRFSRERFPSESSDSTLGTTEPGLLRLKKQRSLSMGSIDMVDIDLNPAHHEEPIPPKPAPKQGKDSSGKYDGKKSKKFLKWERMKKVFTGAKTDQNQKTDSGAITAEQLVRVNSKHPHHFKPPPLTHGKSVNGSHTPKTLKPEDTELSRSNSHLDPVPASPSSVQSEPPESIPAAAVIDDGPSSPPALMPPVVLRTSSSALSLAASDEPPGSLGIELDEARYFSDNEAEKSERAMFLDVGRAHRLRRRQSSPTLSLQSQERINLNEPLTPNITRSSSFKVKSSETEEENYKLHEAELLSALECYDDVGKLHGERGPSSRKGQRSLGKAAWGKVKDIIHTRKDSIKRRNRDRPLTGSDVSGEFTDGEITPDGPSYEYKHEYRSKGDYLDPPDAMEQLPFAMDEPSPQTRRKLSIKMDRSRSPRSSPHGSTKDRSPSQSPSAVGNDNQSPISPAPVSGSPMDLAALMGGMSEEFNRKMQEWEDRKKGLWKLGGNFSFDEEASKDEYSTKFSEEFIRKMEEWEKIKLKGLSKEKAHPPGPTTPMDHTMQDIQKTLSESFCKTVQEWERVRDERDRKHKVEGSPTRDVRSPDKRSRSDTRADIKSPDKRARKDDRSEVRSADKRARNETRSDAKSPDKRGKKEEPEKRSRKEERPTREDRAKKHERSKSKERDKSRQRYEKELQKIEKREQKIEKEKQKLERLKMKLDMNLEGTGSPGSEAKNDGGLSEDFKKKMQEWELMKGLRSDQPNELQPEPDQSKPKSEGIQRPASMSGAIPPMERSESETSSQQSKRSSLILQPSPSEVDVSTQSKRSSLTLQSTSEGEFTIVSKRSSLTLPSSYSLYSESASPSPSPSPNPDTASDHSAFADLLPDEASIQPESASPQQEQIIPPTDTASLAPAPDTAVMPSESTAEQTTYVADMPSDMTNQATDLPSVTSEPVDHHVDTEIVQSQTSSDIPADVESVPSTAEIRETETISKEEDQANHVDTSETVTTVDDIECSEVENIGIQTEAASLDTKQVQTERQRSGSHEAHLANLMELQEINSKMKQELNDKSEDVTLLRHDVEQLTERMNMVTQEHSQEIESYRRQLWASSKIGNSSIKTDLLDSCLQEINQKVLELQEYGVKEAVEKNQLQGKVIEEEEGRNNVRKTLLEQIEQIQLSIDKKTLSGQKVDLMERLYQYLDKVQSQLNDLKLGVMEKNRLIEEMQKTVLFHEIDNKLLQADLLRRDMEVQKMRESRKSRVLRRWKTFHGRDFIIRDDGMVCLKNGSSKPIWKLTMHQPPGRLNYGQVDDMSLHFDWLDELKKQVEQVNEGVSTGVQAVPPTVDTDNTSVQTVMTFSLNSSLSDSKSVQTSLQDLSKIVGIIPEEEKKEPEVSLEPETASVEIEDHIPSSVATDDSVCAARKQSLLEEDDLTVTFVFSFDENTETGFTLEESVSSESQDPAQTESENQTTDENEVEPDAIAHISLPEEDNDNTEVTEIVLEQVADRLENHVPVRRKSTGTIHQESLSNLESRPPPLPHSPNIRSRYSREFKADIKVHQLHTDLKTWNATPPRRNIRHRKHSSEKTSHHGEDSGSATTTTDGSFENIHLRPMRQRTSSDSQVFHSRTLMASSPVREIYLRRARRELRSLPLSDIINKYDQQAFNRESRSRKSHSPLRRPIVSSVQRLKTAAELMHDSEVRHEQKRRSQSATRYRASSPTSPFPATLADKENERFDFLVRNDPKLQQLMQRLSREGSPSGGSHSREHSPLSHDVVRKVSSSSLDSPRVKPPLKDLTNDGKVKNLKQALRSNRNGERQRQLSSPPRDALSTRYNREQIKTGTVTKRAELFQAKNRKAQPVSGATGGQTDTSEKDQFSPKKDKSHKFFAKKQPSSSTSGSGATGGGAITALCRQAVTVEVDDEEPRSEIHTHTEKPVTSSKQEDSGEKKKGKTKILEGNWFQKPKKFFKSSKC